MGSQSVRHDWTTFTSLSVYLGEGSRTPLQYSCLENSMDGGAWKAAVHEVTKSRTWLSDFTFTFHFHALAKAMATHSTVFAWRIPGTGEPGGLLSLGLHRVGHDWSDLAAWKLRPCYVGWKRDKLTVEKNKEPRNRPIELYLLYKKHAKLTWTERLQ